MRVSVIALVCLLLLLGPAAAEDEKKEEPKKPAPEMTEAEREAALKKAKRLNQRLVSLHGEAKYAQALPVAREALKIRENALGPEHPDVALSLYNLASLLDNLRHYEEARPLYERALKIREKALGAEHPDVALTLNNLASVLVTLRQYKEARPLFERALKIREKALGLEHPRVALSLHNLASMLVTLRQYEEARPLYERALKIRENAFGPGHPDVAPSLNNLASLLLDLRQYEEARPLFERALKIWEKALGLEHPRVALSLSNLALLLQNLRQFEEARPLHERALKIREKAFGPEHPDVASSLHNLASLLKTLGQYEEARLHYERAIKIREKALGAEHPNVASSLHSLASLLQTLGQYEEARLLYERALKIRENAFGPGHPDVAPSLHNLASLLLDLGQYEEASPLCERALEIWEKALGPEHPYVASSLNNLASVLQALGQYEEARLLYERALKIRAKALGPEHPTVASSLNNLASLLNTLGQYQEARLLYERALKILEKTLGPERPRLALSLNNLASLLATLRQYKEARPLFERALKIWEKALGLEHPRVALSLNNLAWLLGDLGRYEEARPLYERALKIREKALGPEHPDVASSLNNLASLLGTLGQYKEARPLFERALEIREEALGPEHPKVAWSLNNLALLLGRLGQYERAVPLLARCLRATEGRVRRGLSGLQTSERLGLLHSLRRYLATWHRVAPHVRRSGLAETLRFKGILSRAMVAERRLARGANAEVLARIAALRAAERQLAKIASSPPSFRDKKKKAKWQEAYANAATEREELAVALARDFAPLRQGLERLDLKLPDIQAAIAQDAVLVDYLRSGDQYIAWVVPQNGDVKRVDLGKAEKIEAASAAFAEQAADSDDPAWGTAAKALRDLIFKPIEAHIGKSVTTLNICPDAALAAVPFGALPSSDGRTPLGVRYTISTLSMAQDLVPWEGAPKPGTGALLLGGVDYGKATAPEKNGQPRVFVDRAPRGGKYLYLAGTKAEVTAIKPGLGKGTTTVLGADATESAVRTASNGKRVLHLATHGFVRDNLMRGLIRGRDDKRWLGASKERQFAAGHDPMNLSGLAMAGANTRKGGGDDDGILTALEASHLDLDGVELVVLSACETALGTAESGEGVIGLVRGFQMAGAKQVIGSLWKVDDDATTALMVKMYELWAPKDGGKRIPAAVALRKAQEYVRGHDKWKHPYYWAAWVIWGVGD